MHTWRHAEEPPRDRLALPRQALAHISLAVLCLLKTALRPATERSHRLTALLLLVSVGLLAAGTLMVAQVAPLVAVALCLAGAVGLLISGFAGTQLDATAHQARLGSGDFPALNRRRE